MDKQDEMVHHPQKNKRNATKERKGKKTIAVWHVKWIGGNVVTLKLLVWHEFEYPTWKNFLIRFIPPRFFWQGKNDEIDSRLYPFATHVDDKSYSSSTLTIVH